MVTATPQRPLTGILWMLVTGLFFIAVTALVKYMGPRLPAAESAFLRYAIGLVFLLPALGALRKTNLSRRQWSLFGLRGFLSCAGRDLVVLRHDPHPHRRGHGDELPRPDLCHVGAAVFLGEKLAARRIAAVCLGLMGAAIILRPGFREVSLGHLAMLFAAVVFAGSYLLAKVLADEVRPAVVVAMLSIFVTLALAPFALPAWVMPTLREVLILTAVAVFATAGHYTMTLAFAAAPVTVTQPITFLQLLWATSLGVLAFNEPVDIWVIIGGFVILGSVTFITWREAMLKRQITPNANATKL